MLPESPRISIVMCDNGIIFIFLLVRFLCPLVVRVGSHNIAVWSGGHLVSVRVPVRGMDWVPLGN